MHPSLAEWSCFMPVVLVLLLIMLFLILKSVCLDNKLYGHPRKLERGLFNLPVSPAHKIVFSTYLVFNKNLSNE